MQTAAIGKAVYKVVLVRVVTQYFSKKQSSSCKSFFRNFSYAIM